jgi:hypothetical protein
MCRENTYFGKPGKHCHNCENLEYCDDDEGGNGGWFCNARNYQTTEEENNHLGQLDNEVYRFKGKRCFESKSK